MILPAVLADPDAAAVDTSDQPTCIDVFTAYDDACTQCAPVSDPVTICGPGTRWSDVRQQCVCECAQDVTAEFGIYQYGVVIDGWSMASITDINNTYRDDFIQQYNELGLPVIQSFLSDNCCIAVRGGQKLTISGTPYTYQFPATDGDSVRCNPSGGYSGTVHFYRTPVLTENMVFSSQAVCTGSRNPTIYIRDAISEGQQPIEFGLGDFEGTYNGWARASLNILNTYKTAFITSYNNGLAPIATFLSGNCCIALSSGNKLVISDTPFGYQFPASMSNDIRCNPSGGYNETKYKFYRVPTLNQNVVFTERDACTTNRNPTIWYRFTS